MARSLRQEIIATPLKGMGDGNHTTGRSGLFLSCYVNNSFLGGLETISYDEAGGVTFQNQIGNSYREPNPQIPDVTGSFTRFQIRGKTFRQVMGLIYRNAGGIMWNQMPFDLHMHQWFQSVDGHFTFEDSHEWVQDCYVTRITVAQNDPSSNRMETVSFVGRAVRESGNGLQTLQSAPGYELGGAFSNLNVHGL